MMRPEIRHLIYFLAAAEELNFTRAARRLHIVPQALSAAIAQLEDILGARLFERSTRRVALTAAGLAYLPFARAAVSAVDEGIDAARGLHGRLRIGLAATGVHPLSAQLLREYASRYPDIAMNIRHFGFADPSGGLRIGSSDVALVRPPFNREGLELTLLTEEARYVVLPDNHRLAHCDRIAFGELVDEPWAITTNDPLSHQFWSVSAQRTRPIPNGPLCLSQEELFEAARTHRAVGLVPASVATAHHWPGLVFVQVRDVPPSTIAVATPASSPTRQALDFLELALETAPQQGRRTLSH
ncbi:LysR family transcriptional regulator [Nocardia beijingensis]|uniref:LysR family transcriptional regulator n=1 Tax=Nocardia beijingensis TaxID=95162 RepID=A0ABW7WS91_9NOCA